MADKDDMTPEQKLGNFTKTIGDVAAMKLRKPPASRKEMQDQKLKEVVDKIKEDHNMKCEKCGGSTTLRARYESTAQKRVKNFPRTIRSSGHFICDDPECKHTMIFRGMFQNG